MKKEEFTALGISEELAVKAETASLKELEGYVTKAEHNTEVEARKRLDGDLKERDKQLKDLKESGGDAEELKKKIGELQEENKNVQKKHDDDMKELKQTSAVKLAVASDSHDADIVAGFIDMSKVVFSDDGKITAGLDEQVKALKGSKAFLFKTDGAGGKDATGGKPGYTPKAGETSTGSLAKSVAESLNKTATGGDNPYAKAWG